MSVELRPFVDGDEALILGLFERSFGKPMSIEYWRWRFRDNPIDAPMIQLAWDGDVLAAHYAVSPVRMAIDGEPRLAALSMTTMTDPDYRGRGLFVQLASALYERLERRGYACVWGFPNAQSHRGFVRDLRWQNVHEIPMLRLEVAGSKQTGAEKIEELTQPAPMLDAVWDRCRKLRPILVWRDAQHLAWRYLQHPSNQYRILATDSGYVVFKRYGDEVDLVDVLVVDEDAQVLSTLVRGVLAAIDDVHAINVWMPLDSPHHLELERVGFAATGPTTYLGMRPFAATRFDMTDVRNWHYGMGDSDVF